MNAGKIIGSGGRSGQREQGPAGFSPNSAGADAGKGQAPSNGQAFQEGGRMNGGGMSQANMAEQFISLLKGKL